MRIQRRVVIVALVVGLCGAAIAQAQNAPKPPAKSNVAADPIAQKPEENAKKAAVPEKKPEQTPKTNNPKPADDPEEKTIRESAAAFVKLYCDHDAKALGELFAPKAELISEDGSVVKGRDAIEKTFVDTFKNNPQASMRVDIDSVRILTPVLAIEEGTTFSKDSPDEPDEVTVYVAIHVKHDGKWRLACVRDWSAAEKELTPHDLLERDLAWLVGDWVDESADSVVHTTCTWSDNGNFLMQEFRISVGGRLAMTGTMRIGWDAVAKQFKSWVFDSRGGHATGAWSWDGERWIVKMQGATAKGEVGSSTNYYRQVDEDTIVWGSFDRMLDGERLENVAEITVKRRPPSPTE